MVYYGHKTKVQSSCESGSTITGTGIHSIYMIGETRVCECSHIEITSYSGHQ